MPFIEMVDRTRSKITSNDVKTPALVGIVALVLAVIGVVGVSSWSALTNDALVVSKQSIQNSSSYEGKKKDGDYSNDAEGQFLVNAGVGSKAVSSFNEVAVYVCGQVQKPGVYTFNQGKRLEDAIEAAGGFTDDASKDALNLARVLQDGEQIKVPSITETSNETAISGDVVSASGWGQSSSQSGNLISINTASTSELESLPGIGKATAAKIIASREEEGPFQSLEDLMRVSGIGEKKYDALKDLICL